MALLRPLQRCCAKLCATVGSLYMPIISMHLSSAGADSIHAAAEVALRWTLLVVRLTGMAVLGLGLLPVLVGLFLELTVLPFR